jgi:cytochrome c oxidase subunit 2
MWSGTPLFPESASTMASRVDSLYFFLLGLSTFFSLLIAGLIVFYAVKYRRRAADSVGSEIHGGLVLELTWTIVPLLITMVIFVWGASVFFAMSRPPDETLNIYVVGKQWMWKFQHLDGQREINELHVPVGRAVRVVFTSEDVLHDLFIPAFRVKADAVPGRYSAIWFEATKVGEYHLFCAEYCGTNHSGMIGTVYVMEPADYQTWLAGGGAISGGGSMADRGAQLFTQLACVTCHLGEGSGRGPSLVGVFGSTVTLTDGTTVVADESYLRESILTSQTKTVAGYQQLMPTFQGLVNENDVASLIEYIKSLQQGAPRTASAQTAP